MSMHTFIKHVEKFTKDNSPAILTALGVTGTLTTAYLTGKATFKAAQLIDDDRFRRTLHETTPPAETKDKVLLIWKEYVPAAGTAILTVTCIVMANRIGTRRAAAMAAAYSISERAFAEYRDKVIEKVGEKKEQTYRDELSEARIARMPVTENSVIITGNGDVLCFDQFTGRYFYSKMETLRKAENDVNFRILQNGYASLSDFYESVGLPATDVSEEVGWTVDKKLECEYSTHLSDDGRPCISVAFYVSPGRDYFRFS